MSKENTSFMYPILMTAKVHVDMMGAEANEVLNQYESLATALCKHKGLDVKAEIDEYNRELKEFIDSDETAKPIVPKDCIGEFMHQVFDMCKTLKKPNKVLRYIKTAYEILEINEPKYASY